MNVDQLFSALSYGVLSNLSLGLDGAGSIDETAQPRVILHANAGLLRLYSKFVLSQKDVLIEMREGVTTYEITSRFAQSTWVSGNGVAYPYIRDLRDPFLDDVIKILEVFDGHGRQMPLNDAEDPRSLFTPRANLLQVPHTQPGVSLSLVYQARHATLSHTTPDQAIALPEVLDEALHAFIAWKVFSGIGTAEATTKAAEHRARYLEVCREAQDDDLVSTSVSTTNSRFAKRGWI